MAALGRRRLGLRRPPNDIAGFPVLQLRKGKVLFRAHKVGNGPWWFASDVGGRFNLDAPAGTCYLAVDGETALRERLGPDMVRPGMVSQTWADETIVSKVSVQRGGRVADTCHKDAPKYGMTREVATYTGARYALTRRWAKKFHEAGLRGVLYESRFTTIAEPNAFALFDSTGAKTSWPEDPSPVPGREACLHAGLSVLAPPSGWAIRTVP
jgi:hypothetical protein